MKDISMFTTEYGIASLALAEIPYKAEAYIRIQTVMPGKLGALIEECVDFCRACGAERIFAAGEADLERYPLHSVVYEMQGDAPEGDIACLWPVTAETMERWRRLANDRLSGVDNAATITSKLATEIVATGGAYFIHDNGNLLGIGWVENDTMHLLATVVPGVGDVVMRTLLTAAGSDRIRLEVASTNEKALRLYEKKGFLITSELRRWYRVFG